MKEIDLKEILNDIKPVNRIYKSHYITFHLLDKDKGYGGYHTCRETLTAYLKKCLMDQAVHRRLRMLIFVRPPDVKDEDNPKVFKPGLSRDEITQKLLRAKSLLNTIERGMGWGLSDLVNVESTKDCPDSIYTYRLSMSPKWVHASELFSLYLLLFRIAYVYDFELPKSIGELDSMVANIKKLKRLSCDAMGDLAKFKAVAKYICTALGRAKDIFFTSTVLENYNTQSANHCGIQNLVTMNTYTTPKIRTNWMRIMDELSRSNKVDNKLQPVQQTAGT